MPPCLHQLSEFLQSGLLHPHPAHRTRHACRTSCRRALLSSFTPAGLEAGSGVLAQPCGGGSGMIFATRHGNFPMDCGKFPLNKSLFRHFAMPSDAALNVPFAGAGAAGAAISMQLRCTGLARAARWAAGVLASSRASPTPRSRRAAPPPPLESLLPTERAPEMCNRRALPLTLSLAAPGRRSRLRRSAAVWCFAGRSSCCPLAHRRAKPRSRPLPWRAYLDASRARAWPAM
jgi:hypothetical protein